ncbi:helix-turn-helix domain-containing protein [Halomonas sp. McH1-25]|uniref:helix-turn-helix transcriptional regulator n=1 Tax=unclassified Halomonas TaxID=2609666 RepID=UPI001EF68BED|nr:MULTISPECIES: helix-turn-helix transcriptional regulator [unclassified Halomonas]MCG7598634.1 helix-turn-helix domain-containing protein [Halomonas sp. McH1-25]MCP1343617.1 helix-turn-helix domain-containing protein [Halomonas sp. FL8]MCP1363304.1 helix-turn-helix domain-containing protein [Halomonas sp. BBD45]MCP1364015.1 helix-turn-helix domain-containing protein [Halomonas sp. BBD48]
MTDEADIETNVKIAVAMRAVRSAMGLNQAQFAELIGVSKPTIARIETLELPMRFEIYAKTLKILKKLGVTVDTLYTDSVHIEIEPKAIDLLKEKLMDDTRRRSDRHQQGVKMLEMLAKTDSEPRRIESVLDRLKKELKEDD